MKPTNYNKNITIGNINKIKRPFSVNTYSQREYNFFSNQLNQNKINNIFDYNKNAYINNKMSKLNGHICKNIIESKQKKPINERKYNQNFDNLSVKIFNLYNLKNKNEPFAIKINNNSPKYYINNCVNQLLFKKLSPDKTNNKILENNINEKTNNNIINSHRYVFSLTSPKNKTYKKVNFDKDKSKKIINIIKSNNSKIIKSSDSSIKNILLRHIKKNKNMNFNNDMNYSIENIYNNSSKNMISSIKNLDIINKTQIGQFDNYFCNSGNKTCKHIDFNKIMNKNDKRFYNEETNKNLTVEYQSRISDNNLISPKTNKINNIKDIKFLNSKQKSKYQKIKFSENTKQEKIKNKNTKDKRAFNSIFDLKNNKFQSKTINELIKKFDINEESDLEKKEFINKKKFIKNKIPYQKVSVTNKINKNLKKIRNDDYEIYLQYNNQNNIEKILLNDKNGRITCFIPSINNNDKYKTLEQINE